MMPGQGFLRKTLLMLGDTHEDDTFTHLILSAPTVDISNLNTSKLTDEDNVEVFKQNVLISSKNMFTVAQDALIRHPQLKKIILMEHAPRYDGAHVDPTQLKPKLAKLANNIYTQLWHSSALKEKIIVASHNLDCSDDLFTAWYTDVKTGRNDGVHMYGSHGKMAYTKSLVQMFKKFLPSQSGTASPTLSQSSSVFHSPCPQTQYQNTQIQGKSRNFGQEPQSNIYTVPVSNQFDVLGNC